MKELKLSIDISDIKIADKEKHKTPEMLSVGVIKNAIRSYGAQKGGLGKKERTLVYKIFEDLDNAIDSNRETQDLEDNRADFLQKVFNEVKIIPNPLIKQIEKNIDEIREVN